MKIVFALLLMVFVYSCNEVGNGEDAGADTAAVLINGAKDTADAKAGNITTDLIIDSLRKIPFVAESQHYIDSFSRHKQGLSFLIDTVPGNLINFRAGYNGEERFETYYIFVVNPGTFDIKIIDPVSGDAVTVAAYQKANP